MSKGSLAQARSVQPSGRMAIAIVSIPAVILVGLLFRTQSNAADIKDATAHIAESGRGINENTDAIMLLDKTNNLAQSILDSTSPLDGTLTSIAALAGETASGTARISSTAQSIYGSARSIDTEVASVRSSVGTIRGQANDISSKLSGVSKNASSIGLTAAAIEKGIRVISSDLGKTVDITSQILRDARGINTRALRTEHLAGCIDNGLNGGGDC